MMSNSREEMLAMGITPPEAEAPTDDEVRRAEDELRAQVSEVKAAMGDLIPRGTANNEVVNLKLEIQSLRTQLAEAEARVEKARNEGLEEAINYATRRQAGWEAECRGVPGHRLEAMHKANAAGAIIGDIRSLITNNLESKEGAVAPGPDKALLDRLERIVLDAKATVASWPEWKARTTPTKGDTE